MKKGSVLIGVLLLMVGLLATGVGLSSAVLSTTLKINRSYLATSALSYAEAGINKSLWELNKTSSSYTGESNNALVTGDVIMSGATGKISNLEVRGNAKAHTIIGSSITNDAWYQVLTSTTVGGTKHPASPDPIDKSFPIPSETITEWEQVALAGGTYEGNMTVSGTSATLGPKKINGNLTLTNNAVVTITGTLWVTGNISLSNNATVKLASSYGTSSGVIIADNLTDKLSYGKISTSNNVQIQGSGAANSYLMLLSTNTGGISSPAINVANNSAAVVYYATTGFLEVSNNAFARAITGGGLNLSNGSKIQYDSGLASTEFSGGPGGSWTIVEWQIYY